MFAMVLCAAFAAPLPQDVPPEHLPLRVLYAGNAGTPYSAAWTKFLGEHVDGVRFVAGRDLRRTDLAGVDLLIVDGEVEDHDANGQLRLKNEHIELRLADLQGVPVVLMGGQGGFLSDQLNLKTSWHHG